MLAAGAADGSPISRPLQRLRRDSQRKIMFFTTAKNHKLEVLIDDYSDNLGCADKG